MVKKTEGDVTKLPKWAQSRIAVLEMRARENERKYEEALALIGVQPDDKDYALILPTAKTVYFDAEADGISVRHEKGVLEIRAGWGGYIGIRPVVSNVIKVVTER